jgi:hypothetical protein
MVLGCCIPKNNVTLELAPLHLMVGLCALRDLTGICWLRRLHEETWFRSRIAGMGVLGQVRLRASARRALILA